MFKVAMPQQIATWELQKNDICIKGVTATLWFLTVEELRKLICSSKNKATGTLHKGCIVYSPQWVSDTHTAYSDC